MRGLRALAGLGALWLLLCAGMCTTMAVQATCLPLAPITPADQKALAAELAKLDDGDPMVRAINDWIRMRDADRACLKARP